jgi:hypothetical protein
MRLCVCFGLEAKTLLQNYYNIVNKKNFFGVYMFIKTNYWNNNYIKLLKSEENNLLTYLATNEFANYSGIIKITNRIISADLGFSLELVNDILAKFANDNICYFDSETNYIIFNKCEFLSFRENLNVKTEVKLKSDFEKLPSRLKEILVEKFADLKPYFSGKKMLELTKNIILNLAEIKAINKENEGVSVNNLIMIKNQVELLINDILNPQNEFSPQYYSYNINNIKSSTENKINKKNTPSNKKNATKETPKTKRGRPKKETKIYADHFIIRDGERIKVGQIEVENCDIDGKELFKPKNKYFKSKVNEADVNYDLVKNMFLSYAKGWSKEGLIAIDKVIARYYEKRASQNWVMNRTLEQDIEKWFNDDLNLKSYRNMAEKTQTIENIENKFKQNEVDYKNIEAKNEFNRYWNWADDNRVGTNNNYGGDATNRGVSDGNMGENQRVERVEQRAEPIPKVPETRLGETEKLVVEKVYDSIKSYKNEDDGVQLLLRTMKNRGEHIHNYFVERGYFYIDS